MDESLDLIAPDELSVGGNLVASPVNRLHWIGGGCFHRDRRNDRGARSFSRPPTPRILHGICRSDKSHCAVFRLGLLLRATCLLQNHNPEASTLALHPAPSS